MCRQQTLAYSSEGYIIRCPECERIQLSFGIAAVLLNGEELCRLGKHLAGLAAEGAIDEADPLKMTSITLNPYTILCLNAEELQALAGLLSQAYALLEVYQMLAEA